MKNAISRSWKGLLVLGVLSLIIVGAYSLSSKPADAAVRPECGPTRQWTCTFRSGTQKTVIGTVCEISQYEQKHKATCQ